ncbi:CRE-SMGL-1 protein [Aphelenchoides avenae]|nr:CRE-SMGL-1 protein [Aphelenchus avenae]
MKLTGGEHLFVGSSAAEQFTRCKTICSDSNGDLLTLRELNLHGGEALAGTALNASLTFLFGWIKFLYSVTFGQTREEVEKKVVFRNELHATRIISLHDYVEKLLSQRRYEEAIELAEKEPEFDIDVIYRRQWKDSRADVTHELIDVLERVADKAWAVEECLRVTSEDVSMHNRLLTLADSLRSSLPQSTIDRIHNAKFVLDAVMRTDSSTELYLRFRSASPLEIACSVAREGKVRLLVDILKHADTSVRCCYLVVLSLVPESLQLKKYEEFLERIVSTDFHLVQEPRLHS